MSRFLPLTLFSLLLAGSAAGEGAVFAQANVPYGQVGANTLRLDLCVPSGPGPFAGVILVHGGGWAGGDKEKDPRPLLAPLTSAGFAWFSINYRLAPRYRYPACLDDVYTAIRWVKAHAATYRVDPSRLALVGESAGGYLVEMAATEGGPDTRVAAVVPFFGPSDLLAQAVGRDGGLRRDLKFLFGCSALDPATRLLLREDSPLTHVHPGLPPFLVFHGTADRIVPYSESVALAERLKADGVPCDFVTIPGGSHAMGNWNRVAPGFKQKFIGWLETTLDASRPAARVAVNTVAS
ncbi:MAG TPA: alpha/beta hydrolase, partial [Opitutaceae bacterium]|nr:alpha/beta hydrolase [Opitutaceae bacterium]